MMKNRFSLVFLRRNALLALALCLFTVPAASTPLHEAASSGDISLAQKLLQRGADPNARDGESETPLHEAAEDGNLEMVGLLLRHGARAGRAGAEGETALHEATEAGHLEIVRELVAYRTPLNISDRQGYTALHLAIIEGHQEIALCLVEAGSSLGALTNRLESPLALARRENMTAVVQAIESRL